jgi:putative ABC transport system permease protein
MTFSQNVSEAFKSVSENKLRTGLTVSIIAIGITALVGILTALDSVENAVTSGLAGLGANTFEIEDQNQQRRSRKGGIVEKRHKAITFFQVEQFLKRFNAEENITVFTYAKQAAEIKAGAKKTNPNTAVIGTDDFYLPCKSQNLAYGRNFSTSEVRYGANTAIIGGEIAEKLFREQAAALDQEISIAGAKFKVIGILEKKGGLGSSASADRTVLVPLKNAQTLGTQSADFIYNMTVFVKNPAKLNFAMEEARGLMRRIRGDKSGENDSFVISRSESLASSMSETSGLLKIGGFGIGLITLLGASIGLMNIMLVSVTERTREIGIRKAIGAKPSDIRKQFLTEAIAICQIGGLIGIITGIGIGNLTAIFIGAGEFFVPVTWLLVALVLCVLVGVFSGFYPAYKASKLDPIEALRYE